MEVIPNVRKVLEAEYGDILPEKQKAGRVV
jgi:hypothetical protein